MKQAIWLLGALNLGEPTQLGLPRVSGDAALTRLFNTILLLGSILAVIMIVVGAIRLALSGGNPANVKNARETILYAIIGLIVTMVAFTVVNFVLARI